MVSDNVVLY